MSLHQFVFLFTTILSLFHSAWMAVSESPRPVVLAKASNTGSTSGANSIQKEFQIPMGKRLMIDLETGGSLHISGWEKEIVSVNGAAIGCYPEDCTFDVSESDEGVEITSEFSNRRDSHRSRIDLEINVPARFDLDIETTGGSIQIDKVEGKIEGTTMGGKLELSGLKGNLSMSTMGGSITLTDSVVDGKVHTMGGPVLIQDVTGDLKGSSMGGTVEYKNVKKKPGADETKETKMTTMGGDLDISDAPSGANLETMGGDIHVSSAADHVKATTMGGDIHIDAIDGWIDAHTMGGDVVANMTGNPSMGKRDVNISSKDGDIEVTLPNGLSVTLDLRLAYTTRARNQYRIISDFPIRLEETDKWDDREGTPRKYIYGKSPETGGQHRIRIETINGNIVLKKAS